jgi:hypothetical protein
MATAKSTEVVEIRPIDMKTVEVTLVGDTPIIMHAWSEKAKRMMLEAQQGKAKGKKKPIKNPVDDFIQSIYWLTEKPAYPDGSSEEVCEEAFNKAIANGAKFGFPVTAFKQAAISAAYRMGWVKNQMGLRGAFFIESEYGDMVEIKSDTPIMREDMVKIAGGTADIRYRGEFRNWSATFKVKYNANGEFSLENIINIINAGGTICGAGEWRPERDGQFGMYHVKAE